MTECAGVGPMSSGEVYARPADGLSRLRGLTYTRHEEVCSVLGAGVKDDSAWRARRIVAGERAKQGIPPPEPTSLDVKTQCLAAAKKRS